MFSKRISGYVFTIIVFITFIFVLYEGIRIKYGVNSIIREYSLELEQYIKTNFPDNDFVKNGLDLKGINNDLSQINNSVNELKNILPTNEELGINKIIYDFVINYTMRKLLRSLTVANYSAKVINSFSDRNNILTISSIINGLQENAIKLVNTILLTVIIIFVLLFLIYIVVTLNIAKREKKYRKV